MLNLFFNGTSDECLEIIREVQDRFANGFKSMQHAGTGGGEHYTYEEDKETLRHAAARYFQLNPDLADPTVQEIRAYVVEHVGYV